MDRINRTLTKLMPIITPLGVLIGFLFPEINVLAPAVIFLFAFITFSGAMSLKLKSLAKAVNKPKLLLIFFFCFHIVLPTISYISTVYFFDANIVAGFILLFGIPTAISSSIWTDIHEGEMSLALAIIIIDTVLSPILVPLTLDIFTGVAVSIDTYAMIKKLNYMVVIPSIIGMLVNALSKGNIPTLVQPYTKPLSKIFLMLVVAINTAKVSVVLNSMEVSYIFVGLICLILVIFGFIIAYYTCKLFKINLKNTIALTYTIGLRNISASFILAASFFPPVTSIVIIFGILFQQFIGAIIGRMLFTNEEKSIIN